MKPCPRFYIGKTLTSVLSYADLLEAYYSLCNLKPAPPIPLTSSPLKGDNFLKRLIQRLEQTCTLANTADIAKYGDSQGRLYDLQDDFVEVEEGEKGGEREFWRAVREQHRVERLVGEEW